MLEKLQKKTKNFRHSTTLKALAKEHFNCSGVIIPSTFEILYIEVSCFFSFSLRYSLMKLGRGYDEILEMRHNPYGSPVSIAL